MKMQKLLEGIIKFKHEGFETHRKLFENLKTGQDPHTLFISCSDSRIDTHMITSTLPGEVFVVRNIANIVPPFEENIKDMATWSAIEYAVLVLGVENIIVCGHSDCGGCEASLNAPKLSKELAGTRKWLELAYPIRNRVMEEIPEEDSEGRRLLMEQANVVQQLKNLMTYPYICENVAKGKLALSGWYYIIETGEVFVYDESTYVFVLPESITPKAL